MGILTDFFIEDEKKRFLITLILDIILIIALVVMAFNTGYAWKHGYQECARQACLVCWQSAESP
jgi:hypothetical protein